jgi:hypothetical protein
MSERTFLTAEHRRMAEDRERIVRWRQWGPYLAERAWATVREDYSEQGDAWGYFPHEHARSRAYRWSEDGLAGICDRNQLLCLALALWNEKDPILKERTFGLSGPEGNHGEDLKEVYFHEDATPTGSYLRYLYKYPQHAFPYGELIARAQERGTHDREVELEDLGIFKDGRYFDVTVEYAKRGPNDILMVITATNHGPERAKIHLLPHLWFRNTWSWSREPSGIPEITALGMDHVAVRQGASALSAVHHDLGDYFFYIDGQAELLFTNNETNTERLFGTPSRTPYVKDAFHHHVVGGDRHRINPAQRGSKAAASRQYNVPPGGSARLVCRLCPEAQEEPFSGTEELLKQRRDEAHAFYAYIQGPHLSADRRPPA